MTEKLYYQDSHIHEFTASVTACEAQDGLFHIILDRTAFFPEGGGQAGDTGFLNDIEVLDTQEKDNVILHYTKKPLETGASVCGRIDWDRRFSRMQQHSAEHIVSGLVHRRFGYDNVGFHLGETEVTLDFNGPVTGEELKEIEWEANRIIWKNLPLEISYPSDEELAKLTYRSKIEIQGQVRIVTLPGVDVCACCAPHVCTTGEIGLLKLTSVRPHRGGVRITMLAGGRALADYREKEASVKRISVLLSAKEELAAEAVSHLKEELYSLNGRLMELQASLVRQKAASVPAGAENAVFFEETLDAASMRELVNLVTPRIRGTACVFTGNDSDGYRYVLGSASGDVLPLCRKLNDAFYGKGGGKPQMAQGSLTGTEKAIRGLLS